MSLVNFYRSTVGKKIIMAATGLIWVGFLVAHMAGNIQAFAGAEKFNGYSAMLHGPLHELLLLMRVVLIVSFVLHVMMALQLSARSRAARPQGYAKRDPQVSTLASRTMLVGGIIVLAFVVFHILHFTTRDVDPAGWATRTDAAGRYDIYGNVAASFRLWWVALIYIVSMVFIGLHLFHGAWSSIRTLGYAKPSANPLKRRIALGLAVVVWLGFTVVPVAVLAGIIR